MYETAHQMWVSAPAKVVFDLIQDVSVWPRVFPSVVHTERLADGDEGWERANIHMWNGETAAAWVALRRTDPAALRLDYRQEQPWHPILDMGGSWIVKPLSDQACQVRILHDYRSADQDVATLTRIEDLIDRNTRAELTALKQAAETDPDLVAVFTDSVDIKATSERIFRFLHEVTEWPEHIPHVTRAELKSLADDVDMLEMDTRTGPDTIHNARSVRVTVPGRKIVQMHLLLPPIADVHIAEWLAEDGRATVRHTVVVKDRDSVEFAQKALRGNSQATLAVCKAKLEAR